MDALTRSHGPERRADKRARLGDVLAILAIALLALFGYLRVHAAEKRIHAAEKRIAVAEQQIRVAEKKIGDDYTFLVESCQRLNILRAEDNLSHLADFLVYRSVYAAFFAPSPNTASARSLHRAIGLKDWTPLTNCTQAVNRRGIRYRAPAPIPFAKRIPPRRDLVPSNR